MVAWSPLSLSVAAVVVRARGPSPEWAETGPLAISERRSRARARGRSAGAAVSSSARALGPGRGPLRAAGRPVGTCGTREHGAAEHNRQRVSGGLPARKKLIEHPKIGRLRNGHEEKSHRRSSLWLAFDRCSRWCRSLDPPMRPEIRSRGGASFSLIGHQRHACIDLGNLGLA